MKIKMERLKINLFIKRDILTANEYISFCKKVIYSLQRIAPIFNIVETWDDENAQIFRFNDDLSNFNEDNLKVIINEDGELAYKNDVESDKMLGINSTSWMGFSSTFSFGKEDVLKNKSVSISIRHGAYDKKQFSIIKVEFSELYQKDYVDKNYIIRVLRLLESQVEIEFANVISNPLFLRFRKKHNFTIGWINYINNTTVVKHLNEDDICYISEKGVIFSISDQFPNIDDDIINKTIQLRDELIRFNYLSK